MQYLWHKSMPIDRKKHSFLFKMSVCSKEVTCCHLLEPFCTQNGITLLKSRGCHVNVTVGGGRKGSCQ